MIKKLIFVLLASMIIFYIVLEIINKPVKEIENFALVDSKEKNISIQNEDRDRIEYDTELLPMSLSGTTVDGGLRIDENKNFMPSYSSIRMFNYFFSTIGEETETQIYARIKSHIFNTLLSPAKEEAEEFLDKYILYKRSIKKLLIDTIDQNMNRLEQADALAKLRAEIFGEVTALTVFGKEDLVRSVDIKKNTILESDEYTEEEKIVLVEELIQQYPASVLAYREKSSKLSSVYSNTQKMKENGASDSDLYVYRKQYLGEESAKKIAELDAKRKQFQEKLAAYREFKVSIVNYSQLEEIEMDSQWLKSNASSSEIIRLRSLQ